MTQKIILFNGPPRSGKDTAARACLESEDLKAYHKVFDRMSMPIKRAFASVTRSNIDRWGNVEYYETNKEEPIPWLGSGVSYRQWQIDFSEKFMKPLYGDSIFGSLFMIAAARQYKDAVFFVPDCGFDIEYKSLAQAIGPENVLVVKIHRPGMDYRGDSRNYLKVGSFGDKRDTEHVTHTNNAGTEAEFKAKIITRVGAWLKGTQL